MRFLFLALFVVLGTATFANDTLYFLLSNPWNTIKDAQGKYVRKAIQTDSGWLALDYNPSNILVCRSYYTDTNFKTKLHCHQYFNETAGYLEQTRCYERGSLNGPNVLFNAKGDTLTLNQFVNNTLVSTKEYGGNEETAKVFQLVEVEAEFKREGGWAAFLSRHLNSNVPIKRKAPAGTYLVVVQFIVDKDGSITQVTPLTQFGYGMEEEVMRVVQKSPKWRPAMQNGKPVKAYRKQPITFVVNGKK
jgi:hypothetical protein